MPNSRESCVTFARVLLTLLMLPGIMCAATIFESFDGALTSPPWSWEGTLGYAGSTSGVTPTNGTEFAYLTTAGSTFTGAKIKPGAGNQSSTNGSVLWRDFTFDGTNEVSFDVMFVTQEDYQAATHERDMATVALLYVPTDGTCCTGLDAPASRLFSARVRQGQGSSSVVPGQGLTITAGVTRTPSADLTALGTVNATLGGRLYTYGTPWYEISFTPPTAGTYRLMFAVTNAKEEFLSNKESALLFDRLEVEGPETPVPEPSTAALVLVGAGLMGLGWFRRRR